MTAPMPDDKQAGLVALAERVIALSASSNAVDVLVEIAFFSPCDEWVTIRANNAGTKVICADHLGFEHTFRASDWTHDKDCREGTASELRALAQQEGGR